MDCDVSKAKPIQMKHGCSICCKRFQRPSHLLRHKRLAHGCAPTDEFHQQKETDGNHECSVCKKKFFTPSHVKKHMRVRHLESVPLNQENSTFIKKMKVRTKNTHQCLICERNYRDSWNLQRHFVRVHGITLSKVNSEHMKCSECQRNFHNFAHYMKHMPTDHSAILLESVRLQFSSDEEFHTWKCNVEEDTMSSYVFVSRKAPTVDCQIEIEQYKCHRGGQYVPEGHGLRNLKIHGSVKTGYYCPARMRVVKRKNCAGVVVIDVTFHSTHVGHQCSVGHLNLSNSDKNNIASKLQFGVPIQRILMDISEKASPTKRIAHTRVQDVRNVAKSYGINLCFQRDQNDMLSVESWVTEMQSSGDNPILMCKPVGRVCDDYPSLTRDDFVLGFMNHAQEEIFNLYHSELVCIDSTHGTTKYDIQLTSLVVKDNVWEGFPVAFLWSNKQNTDVYRWFFSAIKDRIGMITTKTFMSDDFPAFYNAWQSVFGQVQFNLICDWHIKRAWTRNATTGPNKITDVQKRQQVLGVLQKIAKEVDEAAFQQRLEEFLTTVTVDDDTHNFAVYFSENYVNRPCQWAGCYRVGSHINTNMSVENWHKNLKYNSDLQGKCGGRLDRAIHSLMKSLRMKMLDRLATLSRGKLTKHIVNIRKCHRAAVEFVDKLQDVSESESMWLVPSFTEPDVQYRVKKNVEGVHEDMNCAIKCHDCQSCIHEYQCSCVDSSIRFNFCKHIHLLLLKMKSQSAPNTHEETSDVMAVSDSENALEILVNPSVQRALQEQAAITEQLKRINPNTATELQEEAQSALMSLLPEIRNITQPQELKEVKQMVSILRNKLLAMRSTDGTLLTTVSKHVPNKNIEPQRRSFPLRKKRLSLRKTSCTATEMELILQPNENDNI